VLTITLFERAPAATILMELYDQAGIVRLDEARTVEAGRSELSLELDGRETYLIKVFADTEEDASAYLVMSW
jgi:hypothetical protein